MSFGEGGEENKSKMSRPFGVSLLIAGVDPATASPQLFHMDPSGTYIEYEAQAIGSGSEGARTMLRERYSKSMTLRQVAVLLMRVLAETMEDKASTTNVELARVTPGEGYRMYSKEELEELIAAAAAEAAAEGAR